MLFRSPAPYGPLFLWLDSLVVQLSGHRALRSVLGLRLLEVMAVALLAVALPRIARALQRDGGEAVVLGALNPLVILTLIGGAHNDALMIGLLCTGVMFALERRPVWGLIFCSLAAAIKAPAALGVVYVAWTWVGPRVQLRERVVPLVKGAAIAVAVLLVATWLAGF